MKLFSNVPLILFLSSEIFQICCVSAGEVIANNLRGRRAEGHAAHHHVIKNDDMCLSLDGRNVIIKDCDGDKKQVWDVDNEENEITNEANDECLDLNTRGDNNIGIWKCRGSINQKFKYDNTNNVIRVLYFTEEDWCLTRDTDENVNAKPCNGSSNQNFFLTFFDPTPPTPTPPTPTPPTPVGQVTIKNENECLSLDGENVVMETCNGDTNQIWDVDDQNDEITNEANDECLDLDRDDNNIGTWECRGKSNQKFKWDPAENVIRVIYFTKEDRCLTRGRDDNVFALPCNGKSKQKFFFSLGDPLSADGPVTIKNEKECLSLDGENVVMENCNGDTNQIWYVDDQKDEITNEANEANDKCLDLNTRGDNNIGTWKCRGKNNQKFKWDPAKNVIRVLYFTKEDWCLTRNTDDNVFAMLCNGKSNQKFEIFTFNPTPPTPTPPTPTPPTPVGQVTIKNEKECLSLDDENVVMKNCKDDTNQNWNVDDQNDEITNEANDKCLDLNTDDNNIGIWKCRGTLNQKFKSDSAKKVIRVLYFTKKDWCLTRDTDDNVFALPCNGNSNQKYELHGN